MKITKKNIIIIWIVIGFLFFGALITREIIGIKKLNIEYPHVKLYDDFSRVITDLYTSKGASFVTLDNSLKVSFYNSRNYDYSGENKYLSHMLSIGDTLIKKRGSFDLIVKKKDREYHFVIGEFINKGNEN